MQFLYGEDGMAGEYIEDQRFETLNMSDKDLEKIINFSIRMMKDMVY